MVSVKLEQKKYPYAGVTCDDLDLCSSHANPRAGVFEGVYNKFPQNAYPLFFLREQGTRKTLLFLVNERHVNERHVVPLIFWE